MTGDRTIKILKINTSMTWMTWMTNKPVLSVCFFLIHCLLNVLVLFFVSSACCHSGSAKTPKNLVARHGFGVLPVVEQARYGKGLHFATSLQFKIVLFIVVPDPDGNNTENTRDRRGGVLLPPLRHKREF